MKFFQPQQPVAKASKAAYIPWNAMALTIKRVQRKEINRLHSICIKLWWGPRRGFSNPRMVRKGFGSLRLWTLNPVNMAISSVLHTLSPNSKFKIKRKMTWNPGFSLEQTIILANNGMIYWICDIKQKQCIKSKELRKKEHWRTNMGDIEILWSPIMYGWVWVSPLYIKVYQCMLPTPPEQTQSLSVGCPNLHYSMQRGINLLLENYPFSIRQSTHENKNFLNCPLFSHFSNFGLQGSVC